MIGIEAIGYYIPEGRNSNLERLEHFDTDEGFVKNKIGIEEVSVMGKDEDTSILAAKAVEDLVVKSGINLNEIEALILVTQNPDKNIPHASAQVHELLELPEACACFDISLGCSGFVYGLATIKSLMESQGMKKGLLITSDPYSKILDPNDKNTSLLFGDGAAATLVSDQPVFEVGQFTFGTIGKEHRNLICENGVLSMNGRGIFNFAARYVPKDMSILMEKNGTTMDDIDHFVFHQGSKYIVDTLTKRLKLDAEKVAFDARHYGNTVSSSIPIILSKMMNNTRAKSVVICGFGVGLSWSSSIITRK